MQTTDSHSVLDRRTPKRGLFCFLVVAFCLCLCAQGVAGSGANAAPFIDLPLLPTSIKPGGAGFALTVNGAGFVAGSTVNWNGSPRVTTFVSKTQLTAAILSSDLAKASTTSITVSSPAPGGGASNVVFFQITNEEPAVGLGVKGACTVPPAAAADFNGDGKLDLAVFNVVGKNTVSILLGEGNATFHNLASYNAGQLPQAAVAGDFNGDGKLDLAMVSYEDGNAEIYLGNGDGTFKAKGKAAVGGRPRWLATGDFNEDGILDLAIAGDDTLSIMLGNGDGTFQRPIEIGGGGGSGYFLLVADFNNDGHLDLAVGSASAMLESNAVTVLLGNGDGTFQVGNPIAFNGWPGQFAVADLNGDGKVDLAVTPGGDKSVSVLLGNGDGTFAAPVSYPLPGTGYIVVFGDFNADGKLDLAVDGLNSTPFAMSTSILLGKGNGTFGPAVSYGSFNTFGSPMFAGDFNGDGRLDLNNGCTFLQTPTAVTLSQISLTFPNQIVGTTSSPKQVKLTNSGTKPVTVASITSSGDFSQTNDCPATLNIFKGCMITVTFAPTAIGTRSGAVTITDNATGSPQTLPLTGTGADLTFSPPSLDFGSEAVGTTSPSQTIQVTNGSSSTTVNLLGISVQGTNRTDFAEANTCGSTLGPGASCSIAVTFTPTAAGARRAFVWIKNNGGGTTQEVILTGTGT
jgi:hypothetical protein